MVEDPQPEILKEIVKTIETELQKGDAIIVQLMDRNDPQSQKAVELITDDFELIEKIKKDLQVIAAKPDKKKVFREKYAKLLTTRRKKFTDFMQPPRSDERLPNQQLPKQRQPARAPLPPTYEQEPGRENGSQSYASQNQRSNEQIPGQKSKQQEQRPSNQQLPPLPNKLQLKRDSEILPPAQAPPLVVPKPPTERQPMDPTRRGQLGQSKETVRSRESSEIQKNEPQPSSVVAFEKFNQYQPRQSSSEVEDFKMFEQKEVQQTSQEDFFGAKIESHVAPMPSSVVQPMPESRKDFFEEGPVAPGSNRPPAQDFFEAQSQQQPITRTEIQQPGFTTALKKKPDRTPFDGTQRSNTQEERTNPFASGRYPAELEFSQKQVATFSSLPLEPANPFEEEPAPRLKTKLFESVEEAFGMNPFEKSSRNFQVTNPFEQTVLSEKGISNPLDYPNINKTEKTNPFSSEDGASQKGARQATFGFADGFRGRLDSMKESLTPEQLERAANRTEPGQPVKKAPVHTEEEFLNIFSKKQSIQPQQSPQFQPAVESDPFKAFTNPSQRVQPAQPSADLGLDFFNPPVRKTGSEFDAKSEKAFEDFFVPPNTEHEPQTDLFQSGQAPHPPADLYPSLPTNPFDSFPPVVPEERVPTEQDLPAESNRFKAPNLSEIASHQFPSTFPSKFETNDQPAHNPYPSVDDFRNFQTISSVERDRLNQRQTPRSNKKDTIQVMLAEEIAKADPTNPQNNPFGNPLNQEIQKVDPNAPLKPGETVELDFQNFIAVKKIGIPWNPFQKKSEGQSPSKSQLYLKMQLDRLNVNIENLKRDYDSEKQIYITRNKDFLEVRSEYMQKLQKLQQIERQKHDYAKMIVRFEEDISRKERMISEENLKMVRLRELKDRKNDCLRQLFQCKVKRNMRHSRGGSRGTVVSNNKFMAFNETAKELHSMASAMQTNRSFRIDSLRSTLIRTRFS